jgi:WD40 repeat protein
MRTRRFTDHTGIVNSCAAASEISSIFASGSDDCTAIVWDSRNKKSGILYMYIISFILY